MNHSGSKQLLVNCHLFQTSLVNKETRMFYVARIVKFSVYSELMYNPNLNLYVTSLMGSGLHGLNKFAIYEL